MVELTGEQPDTGEAPGEGLTEMSGGQGYPDVVPSEAVELAGLVAADAGYDGLVTGVKDFGTFIYVRPTNIDYWPDHLYLKVNVPEQLQDATRLTTRNDSVLITGVWAVRDGEVQVDAGNLTVEIGQEVALWPLGMPNRSVGGAAFVAESGPLANTGVEHAYGAYNLGAWVRVCGRVTAVDDTPGHEFPEFFYLDDGSLLLDTTGYTGLRINLAGHGYQADPTPFPIQLAYEVTGCATMQSDRFGATRTYLWLGERLPAVSGRRRTRMHLFEMDRELDLGTFAAPSELTHWEPIYHAYWPLLLDMSYAADSDSLWAGGQEYPVSAFPPLSANGEVYEFACGGHGWRHVASQ